MTRIDEAQLRRWAAESSDRMQLWTRFVNETGASAIAEIGVYRGAFAARLLSGCPDIETYFMIDPWRHLDDWNKPANKADDVFERYRDEAMNVTAEWADRRVVLRGTTAEVIDELPDGALDFAYIDGDHTLRGITVDLVKVFSKVRSGGWIGGDDFSPSIWQHGEVYEPTLVFPYAAHFAEAVNARIYGLPHKQFLIEKDESAPGFVDLSGRYGALDLRSQLWRRAARAPLRRRVRRRLRRFREQVRGRSRRIS